MREKLKKKKIHDNKIYRYNFVKYKMELIPLPLSPLTPLASTDPSFQYHATPATLFLLLSPFFQLPPPF